MTSLIMFCCCGTDEGFLNSCGKDLRVVFGTVRLRKKIGQSVPPLHVHKRFGLKKAFDKIEALFRAL